MNNNPLIIFLYQTENLGESLPLTFRFLESGKQSDTDTEDVKLVCYNKEIEGNIYSLRSYKPVSRLISL